ncbi:MAG TPA: PH domain-containing protein [Actinomycetales bacterium]|nr:PH domain-containing protein [Actinomycetales bacterium]
MSSEGFQDTDHGTTTRTIAGNDPFAPLGVTWTPVSPRLVTARRLVLGVVALVPLLAVVVAAIFTGWLWLLLLLLPWLAIVGWLFWLIGRQIRAIGYAEREDDLLIRSGVMFKNMVVVPYGRMQYVDVEAGPIDRAFGVARVQLHTASPGTDAAIPGLVPEEAARLRERLASRGEAKLAGL